MTLLSDTPILYVPRPSRLTALVRSRFRSPDIDRATVSRILAADYNLELTGPPDNLPNTRRNRNLIVETRAGRMVLKHYRADWRPETIDFEHSILTRLAEIDCPAPRLVPAADGRTWVTRDGGRYTLFRFIDGINYSSSFLLRPQRLQLTALLGAILAGLHVRLAGFVPAVRHHLGFMGYDAPRQRDMAWHRAMVAELTARSAGLADEAAAQQAAWLVGRREAMLDEMAFLDDVLSSASLPRVIIHGDYGLHNLVVQSLNRATPVDFELARLEWRLSDLASCLSKMRTDVGTYDFESMYCFMRAYRAVFPISAEEWRYFPDVLKFYRLMGAIQYWKSYFETNGPARKLAAARDALEQSSWAREYPREVRELGEG
jgi:Ser/Thr protein kinase RdoA (MazF antagonist)